MFKTVTAYHQALPPIWVNGFAQTCREWFDQFDKEASEGARENIHTTLCLHGGIGLFLSNHEGTSRAEVIAEYQDAIKMMPIWRQMAEGRPLYWLADMVSVRRQRATEPTKALGWHQDSAVVLSNLRAWWIAGFVVWVPLTAIDCVTPGLQIQPNWIYWPMKHAGNPANKYLEARHRPRGRILTIDRMAQGDVLAFDLRCPHRTHIVDSMTKDRLSIDLRVVRKVPKAYRGQVIKVA